MTYPTELTRISWRKANSRSETGNVPEEFRISCHAIRRKLSKTTRNISKEPRKYLDQFSTGHRFEICNRFKLIKYIYEMVHDIYLK